MTGWIVGWAFRQHCGSAAAKLILVKLADQANDAGDSWPSIDRMIAETELGQSTIYRHLGALVEVSLITPKTIIAEFKDKPGQKFEVSGYHLNLPADMLKIPVAGKSGTRAGKKTPAAGKNIPAAGITLIEPPKEPPNNLAPSAAPPGGRAGRLAQAIGRDGFESWFGDAVFEAGPPCRITVASEFKLNWITTRLISQVHRVFGDDVVITSEHRQAPSVPTQATKVAAPQSPDADALPHWVGQ